jgi:hypothetical protein
VTGGLSRGGLRGLRTTLLLACALAATGAAHRQMDTASRIDRGEMFVPSPKQARLSTLGFDGLVADFWWLRAVQIVGGERYGVGAHAPLIGRLVDVVTTIDPWVDHPYRFAAVWLTESVESVQAANRLLERAIAYHPRDWRNRHYLGFNYFFYLSDDERAAEILEGAVQLPGAPPYLAGLVAKLRTHRGGLDTAAAFLQELVRTTDDPYAEAEYLKALDEVETERRARALDRARRRYRERTGRDISAVEDLLAGPRPVLRKLPPAHPLLPGFRWELDAETGEIVSSYYEGRYRPRVHRLDRERRAQWKRQLEAQAESAR